MGGEEGWKGFLGKIKVSGVSENEGKLIDMWMEKRGSVWKIRQPCVMSLAFQSLLR